MNILSDKDHQLLQLINSLYLNGASTADSILSKINISSSKLLSSIIILNDMIYPNHISNKNNLISLYIHPNSSYDFCVSKLLHNSLEYSIAESVFFEQHKTYLALAEELHVSESTIKRSILQINLYLKKYDITIKTKPLRIEGNERNIRYFFILFFSAKYSLNNLPFTEKLKLQLGQFYDLSTKIFRNKSNLQDRSNFTLYTIVAYEREKNYHKLSIKGSDNIKFLVNTINSLPKKLTKINKIDSQQEIEFWINTFSMFVNNETLNIVPLFSKKRQKVFHSKGITRFLHLFCQVFKVELSNKELLALSSEIYEIMFGFLKPRTLMEPMNNFYVIFYNKNDFFMESYKTLTKEIFIHCFPSDLHYYFEFVFFVLTTNFPNLIDNFFTLFARLTITIFVDFDFQFSFYLKSKLEKIIPGDITFVLVDSYELLVDSKTIENSDLLITNIFNFSDFKFPPEKTYCISHHLSSNDIQNLNELIADIYKDKYQEIITEGKEFLAKL